MPLFDKKPFSYDIVREGEEIILQINCETYTRVPSLEDDPITMSKTIDILNEAGTITKIVYFQRRNIEYDYSQTILLKELADLYKKLLRERDILSYNAFVYDKTCTKCITKWYADIKNIVSNMLRSDPIGAYVELKRILRDENIKLQKATDTRCKHCEQKYISLVTHITELLGSTQLLSTAKPHLAGYKVGSRDLYRMIFKPLIKPDFLFTKLMSKFPEEGEELDSYEVNNTEVTIFKIPDTIQYLYHINPPEFRLSEDKYEILDSARKIMTEHKPKKSEFVDPERMRAVFYNIGHDLIEELTQFKKIRLSDKDIDELTNILVRYTVGFGLIEVLLQDENIQDITINSPMGEVPMFLVHAEFGDCRTNIIPTTTEADSWASKLRMISGRPLDEANPVLDTELILPGARSRVAVITSPLDPTGLAYAFRRHRDKPWTLPLFIHNKMINSLGAGILSFLVDGSRTMLVAGTRSAGKCVDGNTLILMSNGDIKSIRELVKGKTQEISDGSIYYPEKEIKLPSLNNYNIKNITANAFWKREAPKELIRLKTQSGKQIITTREHPYFIYNKGIKQQRAENLKQGQYIATPRKVIAQSEKVKLNLACIKDKVMEEKGNYKIKGKTNSNTAKFPKYMNTELAEFLGFLLGDGHLSLAKLEFTNSNKALRKRFIYLASTFGIPIREFKSRNTWTVQIKCRALSRTLNSLFGIPFGKKAAKIKIPSQILKSNNKILSGFIRTYFDCEAHVSRRRRRDIEISSASNDMIEQLKMVLSRFEIIPFCKKKLVKGTPYNRLFIRGSFVESYSKKINFYHPSKKRELAKQINSGIIDNTNIDIIPNGNFLVKELRKCLRIIPKELRTAIGKDYWAYEHNRYNTTRKWFREYVKYFNQRLNSLEEVNEKITKLQKFTQINNGINKFLEDIHSLKNVFDMSYSELSSYLSISDRGLRKILNKGNISMLDILNRFANISSFLNKKIHYNMMNYPTQVPNLKDWIDSTPLTYAKISKETGIPETSLKGYAYGSILVPDQRKVIIERVLLKYKQYIKEKLNDSSEILEKIVRFSKTLDQNLVSYSAIGSLLEHLRNKLNIKNEELITENLSIGTISNFFNGYFDRPSITTINELIKRTVEIYENAVSDNTKQLLECAKNLANSDIFWDKIIEVKEVKPKKKWVYDITIESTQNFIANGIFAHNTSLLGALLTEIMRKYRIITIEDTLELPGDSLRKLGYNIQQMKVAAAMTKATAEVSAEEGIRTTLRMGDSCLIVGEVRSSLRGDQEVVIIENGLTKRIAIKNLENLDLKSIYLPTLTTEDKMELKQISGFVKHPKRSQLIKLTTKTGRSVVVTPDHSVFTHVNFKIAAIKTDQLKAEDPVIIPSKLPNNFNDIDYINLLDIFKEDYRLENAEPYVRKAIKFLGWKKASKICKVSDIYHYLLSTQKTRIPINSFLKLMKEAKVKYNIEDLRIKKGTANSIPAKFPLNENIMRFIGYYLAEGNIGKDKIQITNSKPKIIEDIKYICEKEFGLKVSQREITGYGSSVQMFIMSKPLMDLLVYFGCGKTSFHKRIPEFVYGLNKRKICALLKGMYSGDGSISSTKRGGNMIRYFSTSKKLVEDTSYALLSLGIVCRLHERALGKKGNKNLFTAEIKQRKYVEHFLENIGFTHKNPQILMKSFPHSKDDSASFDPKELENHLKLPRKYRHLRKTKCCSKDYLKRITEEVKCSDELYNFAHGDFFIDRVKSIELINLKEPENVYDLEVKSTQRFIGGFGGILLHNTEAKSLYEAMRIGALANIVAGTIHADSPYGVFDRVVNDLGVQRTSFKATDIVVVANPIKSADGMHKWRRVTQISEIRKHWEQDPLLENGFSDLMKYDSKSDELQPSDDLINGESEILKSIAGSVKDWAGNWDAVWDNIQLRTKIKETIVDFATKQKDLSLLEAQFVIQCNDEFHRISDNVKEEVGSLDSKRIFFEWNEWLKRSIKKKKIK